MHYMFKADEDTMPNDRQQGSDASGEISLVAPKRWTPRLNPSWDQSSFDLHNGLEVSEDELDTVPAELFNDLFKPSL
jgi:hypothetical protein